MNWNAIRPWLGTVVRIVLGAVWIWAAVSKLADPRGFTQAVRAYDATPEWLSKAIGYGLPVLELAIGVLLVLGLVVRLAAAVSAVLLVVFVVGLIQASARGIALECGCFGGGGTTEGSTTYTLDILRDIGLLLLAAYLVVWFYTWLSLDEYLSRNDHVETPSAKRLRTEQGRRKYNAMVEARQSAARSRTVWLNGSLVGVIVLVALIGIGVQSGRAKIAGSLSASHASVSAGVVYGKAAAATVYVYEDFQCPNCLNFEKSVGSTLDADVVANQAQVHFYPISILDRSSSGNRYSSRAANAALCASDASVDDFVAYHNVLYGTIKGTQVQPAEGSSGRPDSSLIDYARAAGITGSALTTFTSCVDTEKHKALVEAMTEHASELGVNGTPTIKVNGANVSATSSALQAAINAALKDGPAPDPSPTAASSASTASGSATPSSAAGASASSSASASVSPSVSASASPSGSAVAATPSG